MAFDSTQEEINSLLRYAAMRGDADEVISLLAQGADPNSADLRLAVQNGHVEIVKILLDKGAEPNARASDGFTPLDDAVWKGHVEIVKILLNAGTDPNAKDPDDDSTPLHMRLLREAMWRLSKLSSIRR